MRAKWKGIKLWENALGCPRVNTTTNILIYWKVKENHKASKIKERDKKAIKYDNAGKWRE